MATNKMKFLNIAWLRYLSAAGLLVLGCTAETGDTTAPDGVEADDPKAAESESATGQSENALVGGTLRGRWRFNELSGQTVFGLSGINGFRGRTPFLDSNDPLRSDLNHPNENPFIGRSLRFRGLGDNAPPNHDYVTVRANQDNFELIETPRVSVEAWIRTGSTPASLGYIVSKGIDTHPGDCSASSYFLYMDSGGMVRFGVTHTGQSLRQSGAKGGLSNLQWHHLVGTYDGTVARLYVDGMLVPGGDAPGAFAGVSYATGKSRNLHFGAYNHPTRLDCELPYQGWIDDVRVYRGALTAADVLERFGHPVPGPDADNDGVTDALDVCPGTPMADRPVSQRGCGCTQIATAAGAACKTDGSRCYNTHGAYVSCVSNAVDSRIGPEESLACANAINSAASQSDIGKPDGTLRCPD